MFLKYTYTDSVTGVPVTIEPASSGPARPRINGLVFGFALESQYPTLAPTFYGTAPDDTDTSVPGILAVLTEAELLEAQTKEMEARKGILLKHMTAAVQHHMDSVAAERNYDGIQSAALRAALPNSPFHAEGVAYGEWMDACWSHCYQVMADVEGGLREQPSTEELIAELPAITLPPALVGAA